MVGSYMHGESGKSLPDSRRLYFLNHYIYICIVTCRAVTMQRKQIIKFIIAVSINGWQTRFRSDGTHATIEVLLEIVFSARSVQRGYKENNLSKNSSTRVEAGSNTFPVNMRVVGGDEKGTLKSERVKYGREHEGTRTRERLRWQGPAAYATDRPVHSSEREAPQETRP
jgi:hypothetical protein